MKKIRILYAEDHLQFRQAVVRELESMNFSIIAQVSNGKELIDKMTLRPDVILLDLQMPVMNGNQALDRIIKSWPDVRVIIVSMHYEELLVENYLERGAKGYISKDAFAGEVELLAEAIKTVMGGGIYVHQRPAEREGFSSRQKQMIPLIIEGYTNKEISEQTGIVERSVEKQKQKIYTKIGGEKAIDFYKYAFSRGLQFLGRVNRRKGV
jgi:DNA-binding NarL/FixJ family response regulator